MAAKNQCSDREIIIIRTFDAPRPLVWRAFTEAEHIAQWWGPKGFTTTVREQDLRPGGNWRYAMRGPDGEEYPCKGVFREVLPMQRFSTTDEFDEGIEKAANADLPGGMVLTVHFEDSGNQTLLTLLIMHASPEECRKHEDMGVVAGWNSSFDCLDEYLASPGLRSLRHLATTSS